ncbi:hypothetical protein HPB47_017663, partial [Ixodes persulcatus]
MTPSTGHSRRMCRILCSEWWQQVRFFRDCLRVTCVHMQRQPGGNRQFREWSNITAQCTEVLWNQVRPTLPTKKKTNAKEGTVVVLGEQLIPEKHKLILQRGPKFCFEPVLNRVEKLRISRSVSRQVPEEEKPRCIAECVDVMASTEGRPTRSQALGPVIEYLASHQLRALLSDKEGFFVIMPESMFSEKASMAVQKNFRQSLQKPSKVKAQAVELLNRLDLQKVAAGVKKQKNLMLEVFFAAKTHKPEIPFRTIVSEKGTWLHALSGYLQRNLDSLVIGDPFGIPSSLAVIEFLKENNPTGCSALSIDVEDLYYSMPHDDLMRS